MEQPFIQKYFKHLPIFEHTVKLIENWKSLDAWICNGQSGLRLNERGKRRFSHAKVKNFLNSGNQAVKIWNIHISEIQKLLHILKASEFSEIQTFENFIDSVKYSFMHPKVYTFKDSEHLRFRQYWVQSYGVSNIHRFRHSRIQNFRELGDRTSEILIFKYKNIPEFICSKTGKDRFRQGKVRGFRFRDSNTLRKASKQRFTDRIIQILKDLYIQSLQSW